MLKKITLLCALTTITAQANADTDTSTNTSTALRANIGYVTMKSELKPPAGSTAQAGEFGNGAIARVGLGYFINKYLAVELDSGIEVMKFTNAQRQSTNIYSVPLMALGQVHFPLLNDTVRPYIGAGYAYRIIANGANNTTIENTGGGVAQAGIDLFPTDWIGFNIDTKYMIQLKNKIKDNGTTYNNKFSVFYATAGVVIPF